ncbi:MAG TPA: class I SAM-dependent methyltransferase [Ilumatobacteraceae bacterium]
MLFALVERLQGTAMDGTNQGLVTMPKARFLRNIFVDGPRSLGARSRRRRWKTFRGHFPDIESMAVIDLGGTVDYWLRAPLHPRRVHVVNLEEPRTDIPDWITVDLGDATDSELPKRVGSYDLVYSNSVIEHVGGHERRRAFAANVAALAPSHWIQTPYRYFPVEPHWVCPFMQYLPLKARARLGLHWPLVHTPHKDLDSAIDAQLSVELLDITSMRHYFADSTIAFDRLAGLVKSVIAIRKG